MRQSFVMKERHLRDLIHMQKRTDWLDGGLCQGSFGVNSMNEPEWGTGGSLEQDGWITQNFGCSDLFNVHTMWLCAPSDRRNGNLHTL